MFAVDKNTRCLKPEDKKILTILKSSNQPLIAAADRPAEPTESYLCSFQNKSKKIETFLMLYLVKSGIRVFYKTQKGAYLPEDFSEVEADALEFLESMGFTMDNIPFQKMSEVEKTEIFSSYPIFTDPEKVSAVDEVIEPEFISSAELAEGLEDALGDVDLQRIPEPSVEKVAKVEEEPIIDSQEMEAVLESSLKTHAEPIIKEEVPEPIKLTPIVADIFDEQTVKIARIIASF
jgi:hypothetical protein